MQRELAPPTWDAPGESMLALNIIASIAGPNPVPIDTWINSKAPLFNKSVQLVSGFNSIGITTNTKARFFIFIPPRGNATSITLKGLTGDTGLPLNPNGPLVITVPSSGAPAAVGLTAGGTIDGCRVIIF